MKALVIGGTGPSGPYIVNGLLDRGYEVTILHGGQHEVEFAQPVEHIHTEFPIVDVIVGPSDASENLTPSIGHGRESRDETPLLGGDKSCEIVPELFVSGPGV